MRWIPAALWAAVIFGLSSVSGSNLPSGFSFQAHFIEYAVLGPLVLFALGDAHPAAFAAAALALCSLYAASDEFHQAFVPMRTPDVLDWATDTMGAAVTIALATIFVFRRRRSQQAL